MPVRAHKKRLPVVTLNSLAVIPGMIIHFDIVKGGAVRSIEKAMVSKDQQIFIVMQKEQGSGDDQEYTEVHRMGSIASVKQVLKLPNKTLRVLVEGVRRARLEEIEEDEEGLRIAVIRPVVESNPLSYGDETDPERVAMIQSFMETMKEYLKYNPKVEKVLSKCKVSNVSFSALMDMYASHLPMSARNRQQLLDAADDREQAVIFCTILENEINILRVRNDLQEQVRERVDKNQKEYFLREQLKAIKEELGGRKSLSDEEEYLERTEKLNASEEVKEKLRKEIDRLSQAASYSSENGVIRGYIETLLDMPWDNASLDNDDLDEAERIQNA